MDSKKDGSPNIRLLISLPIILITTFTLCSKVITKDSVKLMKETEKTTQTVAMKKESTVTSRSSVDRDRYLQNEETVDQLSEIDLLQEYIDYANDNVIQPLQHYISIDEVTISKDMDLTIRTGLSKEDFKELVANVKADTSGFFYENADYIYDLCEEYELNEIFFCGLISAESGWNIAGNHRSTYNYISLMSGGKLLQFNSVEDGLERAAKALHNNYLTEGGRFYFGKTLSAVKTRFCPESSTWVDLVYGRMKQML